jgi:cellulose synthase/poly-beta-1,6-N-acetylglucosamine synthase-like glycosyltransferase
LEAETKVVALLDADTRPSQQWLTRLVAPFREDQVGAVTGIRWYQPKDSAWGSWVRYVWNAAAIVQMWFYGIPWGGTWAIRRQFLEEAQLLDVWQTSFCEDTPLPQVLKRSGYRLVFATDLIVTNHESCRWQGLSRWVGRQLLTTRLHHSCWFNVLGHALLSVSLLIAGLIGVTVYTALGDWLATVLILGGIMLYQAVMVGLVRQISRAVETQSSRSENAREIRSKGIFGLLAAIVLSQLTYAIGAWIACWSKRVDWRGITYQIGPQRAIRRLHYLPMIETELQKSKHSID